jgi:hypothetical protein
MIDVPTITEAEMVGRIRTNLESMPYKSSYSHFGAAPAATEPAAYVLILGAGFSYGVVPLVDELMQQTIGDYYFADQEGSSDERPASVLRKDSASFWKEFNTAAAGAKLPPVDLDGNGLPKNPGAAYQRLFTYDGANVLFRQRAHKIGKPSFIERLGQHRVKLREPMKRPAEPSNTGERFVKGFLQYVLDPGSEHGYGSTGRNRLNAAHIHLAALLEAQQLGREWGTRAFCRTIITTNFDTLLQNALQMVNLLYRLTDRPENGLHHEDFRAEEGPIHLVYTHGSILRHNPASSMDELDGLAGKNIDVLRSYLESRDVIAVGYSGWNDGLMAALRRCQPGRHQVYWCDVLSQPSSYVASFLNERAGNAAYIHLGESGADGLMRALYKALIPAKARRDPFQQYQDWHDLVWNR